MGRMKEISSQLLACEWDAIDALHRLAEQHPNERMRQQASQFSQQIENMAIERALKTKGKVWTSRQQTDVATQ